MGSALEIKKLFLGQLSSLLPSEAFAHGTLVLDGISEHVAHA